MTESKIEDRFNVRWCNGKSSCDLTKLLISSKSEGGCYFNVVILSKTASRTSHKQFGKIHRIDDSNCKACRKIHSMLLTSYSSDADNFFAKTESIKLISKTIIVSILNERVIR